MILYADWYCHTLTSSKPCILKSLHAPILSIIYAYWHACISYLHTFRFMYSSVFTCILACSFEFEGLYRCPDSVSPFFVWPFLSSGATQTLFDEKEITLSFHRHPKGIHKDNLEPTFITILCPEHISKQAFKIAFVKFGLLISVFKGTHFLTELLGICIIDAELSTCLIRRALLQCTLWNIMRCLLSRSLLLPLDTLAWLSKPVTD